MTFFYLFTQFQNKQLVERQSHHCTFLRHLHTITTAKQRYKNMRRLFLITILSLLAATSSVSAQERHVENRPYADLRPFHFGILVGTHLQDIELMNAGPITITNEDGTTYESVVTTDQDRWDAGFTVGVLGEFRINQNFQFRLAPTMYFGNRHIKFHNLSQTDGAGNPIEQSQDMKTIYIATACELIFDGPRFNNHRPYLVGGLTPMLNLSGGDDDYIRLKRYDVFASIGVGCDFYLPFFKLRPELKFMYSLVDALDADHPAQLRDKNMLPYALSVNKAHTKIIALTFYFE